MSKPATAPELMLATRTPAYLQAAAVELDGSHSRPQLAAVEDETPAPRDPGTVAEIWLYGVVGGWWRGFDAESVAKALRGIEADTIYVRLHSPGGYAPDGIAIANLFRNHTAHMVVVVDGLAASAASVIASAGDEVVMCPGSQMMLHDASTFKWGNAGDLRLAADWIDGQSQNYAEVYAFRAGGTADEWRQVMLANERQGTWYTAQGTVDAKLADRVGTVKAVGSPPVEPDEDYDDEDFLARVAHDVALLEQTVHPAARAAWSGQQGAPKPPSASAVGSPTPPGTESAVALSDEQMKTMRAKLGVAEDADEATIMAALDEALDERADPPANPSTASVQVPEGMQLVESSVLDDLRAGAADGRSAREELNNQARDAAISAAVAAGKTTPARREHWEAAWKADPKGAKEQLDALAPGLVPTSESGHAEDTASTSTTLADVQNEAGYADWKVEG